MVSPSLVRHYPLVSERKLTALLTGAKRQIENALKDKKVIADEDLHRTALYLAHQTLGAIKEMFSGE